MNRPFKIIFLTFFVFTNVTAQVTHNIDSLKKVYQNNRSDYDFACYLAQSYEFENEDSARFYAKLFFDQIRKDDNERIARYYNIYGNIFLTKNNLDSSIHFYRLALESMRKTNKKFDAAVYIYNLGQVYMTKGEIAKSISLFSEAIAIYRAGEDSKYKDDKLASAYSTLGDAYGLMGLYDLALENLYRGLNLQVKHNSLMDIGLTYNSIGAIQDNMGELKKSNASNFEALAIFNLVKYPLAKGTVCLNIGKIYFKLNQLDSARIFATLAEQTIVDAKTTYNLGNVYSLFAEIETKAGNYLIAQKYYLKSLDINKAEPSQPIYGQTLMGYSEVLLKIGERRSAYENLGQALYLFNKENLLKDKKECLQKMVSYFFLINKPDSAHKYYQLYLIAADSFLNTEKQNSIVAQEIKYETSLKEATIGKQKADLNTKRIQNIYLIVGSIILGIVAVGLTMQYRKIKNKNLVILKQKQEILHNNKNNLNQLISIFQRQSRIPGNEKWALENQERLFTLNLLNKMLYDNEGKSTANVNEYLPKLCDAKKMSTGNKVDIIVNANNINLDINLLKDIGLIVNELSMNAIKHAFENTSHPLISIYVSKEDKEILLVVQDNGKGIDENILLKTSNGFGIQFINDLIAQHHGWLKVVNKNGARFEIRLQQK